MKLTFNDIQEITVGAVEIFNESDGVHFGKCTKEQINVWKKHAEFLYNTAKATTGVRFDFHSDTDFIKLTLSKGNYELKVDGLLVKRYKALDNEEICYDLGEKGKEKHIVFSLPSHDADGIIKSFEIADGSYIKRHTFDRKILFLGDSITQGWNSDYDQNSYAYQVSDFLNAESVIQGVGGSFFEPLTVVPIGFNPEIIFIAYGTNDFMRLSDINELEKNATQYIQKVKELYKSAKIFVISPIWRQNQVSNMGTFSDCTSKIKSVAKKLNVNVIDGDKIIPPLPEIMSDEVHPNGLGFSLYTLNLLKQLKNKI